MNTYKLIDLTYLKGLSDGDDQFVKKMLSLFLVQMPEAISNLEKHYNNKEWNLLRTTAHKLKASYMFLGVKDLPEMVGSVEEHATNKTKLDLLPEIIFNIKDISRTILEELETEQKFLR